MARTDPQVNLRMPAALKERLEEIATASGRSFTAEVVARLEQSVRATDAPLQHLIQQYQELKELLSTAEFEIVKGSSQDLGEGRRSARMKIRFPKKQSE